MNTLGSLNIIFLIVIGTLLLCSNDSLSWLTCTSPENDCIQDKHLSQKRLEYVAAVVEYQPIPIAGQTASNALLSNVNAYIKLMEDASDHNVDIIVFPEYGITTIALPAHREQVRDYLVRLPLIGSNPCDENNEVSNNFMVLYNLSCAARRSNMYLVVNLGEIDECSEEDVEVKRCEKVGIFHYNTNVVFGRTGEIVARYRKFHLYFEPQFDPPQLEFSTFETDFGIEFGLFTCFDIIFANPAVELVALKGIRNFVFPTAWVDELPFLTAIQSQSLWAQSNNANLLASGYHQPDRGSMGSGIYSGQGTLDYIFDPSSGTKLVISSVPIPIHPEMHVESNNQQKSLPRTREDYSKISANSHFWLREDLSNCTYKTLNSALKKDSLCYQDRFCCEIEYDIKTTPQTSGEIKLIVFDDKRTVAAKTDWFEWQLCALVYCLNDTIESCTENIDTSNQQISHPIITHLSIRMQPLKLEYEREGVAQPALSLLDTSFNLIPQTYFELRHERDGQNGLLYAQANTKNSTNIADLHVKTVALIQKIYSGRL